MKNKAPISQRKAPTQKRSRSAVDAIFTATTQILKTVGYGATTTNSIAQRAGVSIGSLYQYFSSKESLVASLMDRLMKQLSDEFARKLDQSSHLPIEEAIDALVRHAVDAFLGDRDQTRAVFEHAPEFDRLPMLYDLRRQVVSSVACHLSKHRERLKVDDADAAAFFIINSVMGVVHTMLFDRKQTMDNEAVSRGLSAMARAYLVKGY